MATTEVERLIRLKTLAESGRPIPPEVAEWLAQGVEAYLDGAESDLATALGLRRNGQESPATLVARQRRDLALWDAAGACGDGSNWDRSKRLHDAVKRFRRSKAGRWMPLETAPATATTVEYHLWVAFRAAHNAELEIPTTPQGLYKILAQLSN